MNVRPRPLAQRERKKESKKQRKKERKRKGEKEQEKENREKEKGEKEKKRKMPFAAAAPGRLSKAHWDLDGKASLHDHAWAPYAVSAKDWHAAVAQAQEWHSKGELFWKPPAAARIGTLFGRRRSASSRSRSTHSQHSSSDAQRDGAELLEIVGGRPLAEATCVRSLPLPPWPPPTVVVLQDLP